MRRRSVLGTWWPARQALAALAVLGAALTGVAVVVVGGSQGQAYGAAAYLLVVLFALFSPAAIAVQVMTGQILLGSLVVGDESPSFFLLAGALAGVIFTAELLATVARMDTPLESHPRYDLPRAALAALLGAGVFGGVAMAGGLPGPGGLLAVVLASAALGVLAWVLVLDLEGSSSPPESSDPRRP